MVKYDIDREIKINFKKLQSSEHIVSQMYIGQVLEL